MGVALLLLVAFLGAGVVQEPTDEETLAALEAEAERLYSEDDLDGAISIYKQLAGRHRDIDERTRMLVAAAWLEHFSGRWEAAQETMLAALSENPDYPFEAAYYSQEFVDLYERSLARVRIERSREARERTRSAVEAIAEERLEDARSLLEEALTLEPGYPEALYNLALVDLETGNDRQAMDGFQRVLAIARGSRAGTAGGGLAPELHAQTLANLGLLHLQQNYLEDAEAAFRESLSLAPDNATAWTNLGLAHRRLGRPDEALEDFRRAYELTPGDAAVVNNLALAHLDSHNWERAAELLGGGVREHPDDARLWLNLGMAQRGLDRLEEASASFRRALELDPQSRLGTGATAATHLALTRLQAGDHGAAIEAAQQALALDPSSVEGLIYLGLAEQAAGDLDAARESLRRALELDPTRADTANNLGNAYFAAGDYEAAAASFRKALELRPDFETARQNLELTEERLERASQAAAESPAPAQERRAAKPRRSETSETAARRRRGSREEGAAAAALGLTLADDRHDASGLRAARVDGIDPGSLAEGAGLRTGDLVVRADSAPIESAAALERRLRSLQPGSSIPLDLVRDDTILRITFPGH